jgi:uncharacterized membrane protein
MAPVNSDAYRQSSPNEEMDELRKEIDRLGVYERDYKRMTNRKRRNRRTGWTLFGLAVFSASILMGLGLVRPYLITLVFWCLAGAMLLTFVGVCMLMAFTALGSDGS